MHNAFENMKLDFFTGEGFAPRMHIIYTVALIRGNSSNAAIFVNFDDFYGHALN